MSIYAQQARIKGLVLNENQLPLAGVTVVVGEFTVVTNENGFYLVAIDAEKEQQVSFAHSGFHGALVAVELKNNEDYELNLILYRDSQTLNEIVIKDDRHRVLGATVVSPVLLRRIPGANAGIENILKTLPGVYSNNELSTQYAVRGGNYDENLVYVNEIEIYKPFLIRSGQQEGLSFTNTDMVENVNFSAGGFQAKYGDKLSSVLDITYRNPTIFKAAVEASFLGGSATVDWVSKNQKWNTISGVRYRDNRLLVNSQETETNFSPTFMDFQTLINFNASTKWQWSFLGNISQNKYHYEPLSRQTNFGTIDNPTALLVAYQGQEKDEYLTLFGAIKAAYQWNDRTKLKFIASGYHTQEQEHFDILASYRLGEIDTNIGSENFGGVTYSRGVGSQLNHARNDYDALIFNAEVKGFHDKDEQQLEWGFKYTREDIIDRLLEWEMVDSAGFSLPNPVLDLRNDQPYNPYYGPLEPFQNVKSRNDLVINRFSGYAQWNYRTEIGQAEVWMNVGVRAHWWQADNGVVQADSKMIVSPRAQFSIKPKWEADMVFRISGGLYAQPPSYREMRAMDGTLNLDLDAQKSIHLVAGNDYSFKLGQRPFKLTTEVYYKKLTAVNTYTLENVRIRYQADNNAEAYVYGADLRLNGEIVPGTESWLSFGYLKTEENYNDRGFIARPTDQRLKFGLLFQDYMPQVPNLKMYLNLVYNTGLPGGSPSYADPYEYQTRLKDYRRADAGFSYVFKDAKIGLDKSWLTVFDELTLGFEIYNLFDNQNAITNTWVRDVYSKVQYGIPNYMTTRTFNLKVNMRL
ncbi:carboxypeptidase-like regulatory domain-containing protein [Flavobacterium sp. NKUCC04_CG]|uniref:TonB-dependent receptor n=1 Tax=Flavobacterium sp. NKUCC04_CG TaxID=2842121 RepID=UPI001C5B03D4|nr:carboxypeptidase-like regulatory domain-containing protein [Flavobacterium sp. NKUCC04_CG]MBW3519433.1 TonB-dependent receptor [Flavobacterium sp. NKUCC04_CG]